MCPQCPQSPAGGCQGAAPGAGGGAGAEAGQHEGGLGAGAAHQDPHHRPPGDGRAERREYSLDRATAAAV